METRLASNLIAVRENINRICASCGRDAGHIELIVVTKTVPASIVRQLHQLGIHDIGENRIQDAEKKILELSLPLTWHMIGHLQKNKAKKAVRLFGAIQSVDSIPLAEVIDSASEEQGKITDIFFQINTSGESAKYGFEPGAFESVLSAAKNLKHTKVKGLMTMAPFTDNESWIRKTFRSLRELRERINPAWKLSMGMSHDYGIALEEGADILRIGTAIFEGVRTN